jgi:hypothetical protein
MKSIKEKAEEYHRVIRVLNKHSTIVDTQCSEMFVKGANYVLEQIEEATNICFDEELRKVIEQLKK